MNYRHALAAIALALGLAGCASYPSNYRSDLLYEDGSYYSPADADYGDYYYAPEPRYDSSPLLFYGSPFYGFDGYCSARYRYCPPFGYSPFLDPYHRFGFILSYGGNGWYDPFRGRYGYPSPYYVRRPHRGHTPDDRGAPPAPQPQVDDPDGATIQTAAPPRARQRWRGSVPVMPAPANSTVRMRYPALAPVRSEPSDSSDGDEDTHKRSSRRGDNRHEQHQQ